MMKDSTIEHEKSFYNAVVCARRLIDKHHIYFRQQVEDLLAKYKQSEIDRFEIEAKNKQNLEEKDNEIKAQAEELLERQQHDEALLQQYQKELQDLREQLSDERTSVRGELVHQMEKHFIKMKNANKELAEGSAKDLEKQRRRFKKQLKREWSKLDQYEMKLIEVEAEKRRIIQDAEKRLKNEQTKGEADRKRRLEEIETHRKSLQEVHETYLKEREVAKKNFDDTKCLAKKQCEKAEKDFDSFRKKLTKLEWLQYKLCTDQLESEDKSDEVSELLTKLKTVNKDVEILESLNEKNCERLKEAEMLLQEKEKILKSCEEKIQENLAEMAEVRDKLVESQQRFGEELGDAVNMVSLERDADLVKIEKDREILMSKHLEHQSALEVLVNENLESSEDDDSLETKEIKGRIVELVRSASPALEDDSLQSKIIEKKVHIHYQQAEVGMNEDERKALYGHEEKYLELCQEIQTARKNEQKALQDKIDALQEMLNNEGNNTTETAVSYYESESSSLTRAHKRIFDVDQELSQKIKERREIEIKLEHVMKQMEQQAECNQEQCRGMIERLQRQGLKLDHDIEEIKKILQSETEEYLKRLK